MAPEPHGPPGRLLEGPEIPIWESAALWYHGSPEALGVLLAGSTVTRDRQLACAFSHKPTLVSIEEDGRIRHNGRRAGWLYTVAETVREGDLVSHPRTTMQPGVEWVTQRDLALQRVGRTRLGGASALSESEVRALLARKKAAQRDP